MTIEQFVLIVTALFSIATVLYIPKRQFRLALISFVTFQFITWAGSIIVVELGKFEYPVREFVRATGVGLTPNFIFKPILFTWFILLYPHRSTLIKKLLHYFIFVSAIIGFIYFISVYTDLQVFKNGTRFSNCIQLYIRFFIYFICCHMYISWFSKKTNLSPGA